jgi:hypothetical protein
MEEVEKVDDIYHEHTEPAPDVLTARYIMIGEGVVVIDTLTGTVELGTGVELDEAAEMFWWEVASFMKDRGVCGE